MPNYDVTDEIIWLMHEMVNSGEDVMWIGPGETVFDRCWSIVQREEGRKRLEREFPQYA